MQVEFNTSASASHTVTVTVRKATTTVNSMKFKVSVIQLCLIMGIIYYPKLMMMWKLSTAN